MNKFLLGVSFLICLVLSNYDFFIFSQSTKGFLIEIYILFKGFGHVESIVCVSGNGISPEGSDRIIFPATNQRPTCPAADTGCYVNYYFSYFDFLFYLRQIILLQRVTYELSGKNRFVTLGCFPSGASDPDGPSSALANTNFNEKVFLNVCNRDNCNSSNSLKMSLLALSTLVCFSLTKFFKF